MNPIMVGVLVGCLVAIFSSSLTFAITVMSKNKAVKNEVVLGIKTHRDIDHQKSITKEIKIHEKECKVREDYFVIKTALVFLVKEAGGNPNEMGLT